MDLRRRHPSSHPWRAAGAFAKIACFSLFSARLAGAADPSGDKTSSSTTSTIIPCVATSSSGAFFDLRPVIAVQAQRVGSKDASSGRFHLSNLHKAPAEDYLARGWDYGSNFMLNICDSVVNPVRDVVGVDEDVWKNVSAYYTEKGNVYSLGQQSATLMPRGRKLVLQYVGGSPCGGDGSTASAKRSDVHDGAKYKLFDDSDEEARPSHALGPSTFAGSGAADKTAGKAVGAKVAGKLAEPAAGEAQASTSTTLRKSATISFLCDHDPLGTQAAISFVGASPDECAYFFEVRSNHACATAEPHKPGSIGPGSVFAIILLIAVLVYVVGGVFYQRTVSHARGWRQLPNYSLWAGTWSCVSDFFFIVTSSCSRLFPHRRGYWHVASSPNLGNRSREEENRLIDQLDEEWED